VAATAQAAPPTHPELPSLSHAGNGACGVATDSQGDLYVAEGATKEVKVYDPSGETVLTSFSTAAATINAPCVLAVDSTGNVYVDGLLREVVKYKPSVFPPAGATYEADTSINGNGKLVASTGNNVRSVAIDPADDHVYVAELNANEIQEFLIPAEPYKLKCKGNETIELHGSGGSETQSTTTEIKAALEAAPVECKTVTVAAGSAAGRQRVTFSGALAKTDVAAIEVIKASGNQTAFQMFNGAPGAHISVYEANGTRIASTIGEGLITSANFSAVDVYGQNGDVYVIDSAHGKALVLNPAGTAILAEITGADATAGAFGSMQYPQLAVDQSNGHVFIDDLPEHHVVDEFDAAGHFVSQLSHSPALEEAFPSDIAVDNGASSPNKGDVYLAALTNGETESHVFAYGALSYAEFFKLKVAKAGNGTGVLTSSPAGIECGASCEAEFEEGTEITLSAAPASDSEFTGWSGCDSESVDHTECTVSINEAREVTAGFATTTLEVTKTGAGTGTITSSPAAISCGASCEADFFPGTVVTLTAAPTAGSKLKAWSGCDSVSGNECTLTMSADRQVSVTFSAKPKIEGLGSSAIHDTSARLEAKVNPNEEATTYQFAYLSQAEWETAGESFTTATKIPASPEPIGDGSKALPVSAHIGGLQPETAYRFRLVAENAVGTTEAEGSLTTYASPLVFEACPNDRFRTNQPSANLPDCRAYEQASPVHKNGNNAEGTVAMAKTSLSGDAVSFEIQGGAPGGEGAQEFPYYLATRGAGNWSTQGMLPPPSAGERAGVGGWSPDFSQVFEQATKFGIGTTFLARSSADHSLTTIAPYTETTYSFQGSTEDGSTAFFATGARAQPLPEAAPNKQNLYAWQRGGPLRLAGVLPDGSTPPQGSTEGITGTDSNPFNQDNHAYSADGSSVFFTDLGTGRLYLRLNPTAPETTQRDGKGNCVPDPTLACTVQVNASEKHNGTGLNGNDAAGPRGADFMTATPDGKVAYFTSTEKLTADATTGEEPQPAAVARAELANPSTTKELGFLPGSAKGVTVDGNYVYWADPEHEAIGRATLDGTTEVKPEFIKLPEVEVHPGVFESANPQDVAADSGHVYWTNSVAEEGESYRVVFKGKYAGADVPQMTCTVTQAEPGGTTCEVSAERDGGAGTNEQQTLTLIGNGSNTRFTLTCDGETTAPIGSNVLEKEEIQAALEAQCGAGNFTLIDGGGLGTIGRADIDGNPGSVNQRFVEGASGPNGITVDSSHVYWANAKAAKHDYVGRADISGDPASVQQEFIPVANGDVAVDSEHIYYSYESTGGGFIRRTDLSGEHEEGIEPASPILAGAQEGPPLAIDGSHLYFANPDGNLIGRVDLNGSGAVTNPVSLVTDAAHPEGLAVDAGHVYWSANQQVEPNPGNDLYRYDAEPHAGKHLTDIAVDNADANGIEAQGVLGASEDGAYLYYVANGVPDGGVENSPNPEGEEAQQGNCVVPKTGGGSGECSLYLWHEGTTTFIARLAATDRSDWAPSGRQKRSRTSAEGQTMLFGSVRQLTAYDNHGTGEFYLYRAGQPGLLCVSCNPTGAPPVGQGGPTLGSVNYPTLGAGAPAPILSRNLSADGRRVFFETTDALVAADTDGDEGCPDVGGYNQFYPSCRDVYEWEAKGSGSCDSEAQNGGCLYLISTGKSSGPSLFADASVDGSDVFFFTYDRLVRQDEDGLLDVYDASEGGGLAAQSDPPPVPCEGEACQEGAKAAPQSPSAGTSSFSGPGNPPATHKKQRKHRKRRHHAKRHHSGKRAAKTTGRTSR
jgi:sugar lactone lactonase YvrE